MAIKMFNVFGIGKEELIHANHCAIKLHYNRTLEPSYFEKLPDDTVFAVMPVMIHEHAEGKLVAEHVRCRINWMDSVPQPDTKEPKPGPICTAWLDVPMVLYEVFKKREYDHNVTARGESA